MNEKEKDKRLIIPKNGFEEEASEGLGRLNREEAEADLRELRGRIERKVRKPRVIWLPAAAAVVILLVASAVYFGIFKERKVPGTDMAMAEAPITDTALIAMAAPIHKTETQSAENTATPGVKGSTRSAVNAPAQTEEMRSARAASDVAGVKKVETIAAMEVMEEDELAEMVIVEVMEEDELEEEVIVEAMPVMQKAAISEKKEKAADAAGVTARLTVGTPDRQTAPVGGMEQFNSWIQRNIKYPEEVVPRDHQVIVVTFKIAADSTLYDLKAEHTAGEPFTNEAFRLLREGPKWEPALQNGKVSVEEVRVSIVFK